MARKLRKGYRESSGGAYWFNQGWRYRPVDAEGYSTGRTMHSDTLADIRAGMADPEVEVGTVWVVEQVNQSRTAFVRVGELRKMAKGPVLKRDK
jgi:hypothetical protein